LWAALRQAALFSCATPSGSLQDGSFFDVIEFREVLSQVFIALADYGTLIGTTASWRTIAIARIEFIDYIHSFGDFAESGKTSVVQVGIVFIVYKKLRRSTIWSASLRKRHKAPLIALFGWIVWNIGVSPLGMNQWVPIDSGLSHETGNHPKKPAVIIEPILYQIVKTICAVRGPGMRHFNDDIALAGFEFGFVGGWGGFIYRGIPWVHEYIFHFLGCFLLGRLISRSFALTASREKDRKQEWHAE